MATRKAASSTRKSAVKKPTSAKQSNRVSTVNAAAATKPSVFMLPAKREYRVLVALIAEFLGTFVLAATYIAGQGQPIIIMFAIAGIVLMFGTLSGAHINPAITIGAWVTRRISGMRALGYIIAQFLGAGLAFAILSAFVKGAATLSAQAAAEGQTAATLFQATAVPSGKEWYLFFAELIGGIILGLAVAAALRVTRKRLVHALTVGFGIFVALLLAASAAAYVGGSAVLNPAVALSLGALKWDIWPIAIYILASVVGATVGFILNDLFVSQTTEK